MSIGSTTVQTSGATGSGTTGPFSFSFRIQASGGSSAASQIEVVKVTVATGAESTLAIDTDYSVTVNNDQDNNPGGSITLVTAITSAYKIYIRRAPSYLQPVDLTPQGSYSAATMETALDQATAWAQDLLDRMKGAPHVGVQKGSGFDGRIRQGVSGKGGYTVVVNSAETGFELAIPSGAPVSSALEPFVIAETLYDAYNLSTISGLAADGVTDDLPTLQAALNAAEADGGGRHYLAAGKTYKLNGRLTLSNSVVLDLNGSTLLFTGANDGITTENNGRVTNGYVSAVGISNYAGPMYLVDDTNGYSRFASTLLDLERMYFLGPADAKGVGIELRGSGSGDGVTAIRINNFFVYRFAKGIFLSQAGSSWVNGSHFHNFFVSGCVNSIYIAGTVANGNRFEAYYIQPNTSSPNAVRAIYCEGTRNVFDGFIWDWHASGSAIAVEFVGENNELRDPNLDEIYVKIHGTKRSDSSVVSGNGGSHLQALDGWLPPVGTGIPSFTGRDDFLLYADKNPDWTVTWTGASPDSGALANVFREGTGEAEWTSLSTTPIVCKIDLGASQTYLFAFGAEFPFGNMPDNVTLEYSTDDVTYSEFLDVTENANHLIALCGKTWKATPFRYLRLTFSNDSGAQVRLQRIFAYSPSMRGRGSIPADENNLRGQLSGVFRSRVNTAFSGSDVDTAQAMLPSGASGVSLTPGLWRFRFEFSADRSAGTNSHTTSILWNFTGTQTQFAGKYRSQNANAGGRTTTDSVRFQAPTAVQVTSANTSATEGLLFSGEGEIEVTVAGVLTPQFQYSAAPGGAPTIRPGTWLEIWRVGDATTESNGPWS